MGGGGSTFKRPTFYHDYGAEGWVFVMDKIPGLTYLDKQYPPQYRLLPIQKRLTPDQTGGTQDYFYGVAATISQYPRSGRVSQNSDNNISFGGGGYTYTMDMGPYSRSYGAYTTRGSLSGGAGTTFLRSSDPFNFTLKDGSGYSIPFDIRKIDGDARSWPGWYLWTSAPLKAGSVLTYQIRHWYNNNEQKTTTVTENRFGQQVNGIRFEPATSIYSETWSLNRP